MRGRDAVVIGVGSAHGDDAIGPLVVEALRRDAAAPALDEDRPRAFVTVAGGDPAALLEAWDGARLAVVVDAVRTGAPAGTVHRFGAREATRARHASWSSHGTGVAPAIELGLSLGRMPGRLVVIGIEAADGSPGMPVTHAVRAALPRALTAVHQELTTG